MSLFDWCFMLLWKIFHTTESSIMVGENRGKPRENLLLSVGFCQTCPRTAGEEVSMSWTNSQCAIKPTSPRRPPMKCVNEKGKSALKNFISSHSYFLVLSLICRHMIWRSQESVHMYFAIYQKVAVYKIKK